MLPLDGVRAVAIAVVMAYHSGLPGLQVGGFYGQDAFFVLSGVLITTLLLHEGGARGRIGLVAFWGRRARRLLPALVLLLLAVDVYVSYVAPPGRYPGFHGDALAALFYFSNWHFVAASSNYFATTGAPSLLTHTWSLAIEEQYYLVWPLVVLAALRLRRGRPEQGVRLVLGLSVAGTLASAAWMARLDADGASPSRLYYGTDTHAQCLLLGSALAAGLWLWRRQRGQDGLLPTASSPGVQAVLSAGGLLGAAGLCWLWTHVTSASPFAYEGGFLCVALCTAAVIVSITAVPRGPLARLLGCRPLAFVGLVSYGMYLWYFPVFAVVTGANTGLRTWPLFAVRVAAVFAIAVASYYAVEQPLRTGRLLRFDRRSWAGRVRPAVAAASAVVLVVGVISVTGSARVAAAPSRVVALPAAVTHPVGAPPVHMLLVGDSLGFTLGWSLGQASLRSTYDYTLDNQATLGCGLVISSWIREHGTPTRPPEECNESTPAASQWPAVLQRRVEATHPDVVLVVAGRWEVYDRKASNGSPWTNITDPADAAYVRAQLERVVTIARAGGARAAIATAPCFSSGEQPDGRPWSEDDAARLAAYNALVRQVVDAHPGTAQVVPLGAIVCPSGRFRQQVDGVTVRAPDGVHYPYYSLADPDAADPDTITQTASFGAWVAPRILPALLRARAALGTSGPH